MISALTAAPDRLTPIAAFVVLIAATMFIAMSVAEVRRRDRQWLVAIGFGLIGVALVTAVIWCSVSQSG